MLNRVELGEKFDKNPQVAINAMAGHEEWMRNEKAC